MSRVYEMQPSTVSRDHRLACNVAVHLPVLKFVHAQEAVDAARAFVQADCPELPRAFVVVRKKGGSSRRIFHTFRKPDGEIVERRLDGRDEEDDGGDE